MKPNNNKTKLKQKSNITQNFFARQDVLSSQNNQTDRKDHKNQPSLISNNNPKLSLVSKTMKSLGYDTIIDENKMNKVDNEANAIFKKDIKPIVMTVQEKAFIQRNDELSQKKMQRIVKERNNNQTDLIKVKQVSLSKPSLELVNQMQNRPSLYSKQPNVSNKHLQIFLSHNSVESETSRLATKPHKSSSYSKSTQKYHLYHKKKVVKHNKSYSSSNDEDNNSRVPINNVSTILTRVKEYTQLQFERDAKLSSNSNNTKLNKHNNKHSQNECNKQINSDHCCNDGRKKIALRVNSAPEFCVSTKETKGKDNIKQKREVVKRNKKQLHWTHSVINPNLNSHRFKHENCDELYKINIRENSSWKREIENVIHANTVTDREIVKYYVE